MPGGYGGSRSFLCAFILSFVSMMVLSGRGRGICVEERGTCMEGGGSRSRLMEGWEFERRRCFYIYFCLYR